MIGSITTGFIKSLRPDAITVIFGFDRFTNAQSSAPVSLSFPGFVYESVWLCSSDEGHFFRVLSSSKSASDAEFEQLVRVADIALDGQILWTNMGVVAGAVHFGGFSERIKAAWACGALEDVTSLPITKINSICEIFVL